MADILYVKYRNKATCRFNEISEENYTFILDSHLDLDDANTFLSELHDSQISVYSNYLNNVEQNYDDAIETIENRDSISFIRAIFALIVSSYLGSDDKKMILDIFRESSSDDAIASLMRIPGDRVITPPLDQQESFIADLMSVPTSSPDDPNAAGAIDVLIDNFDAVLKAILQDNEVMSLLKQMSIKLKNRLSSKTSS